MIEQEDFVKGALAGTRQVPRRVKEDAYVEWFEDMDADAIDYYLLGNIFGYEAMNGTLYERLKASENQ